MVGPDDTYGIVRSRTLRDAWVSNLAQIRTASETMVITEAERKEIGPLRRPRAPGGIGGPSWDTNNTSTEFQTSQKTRATEG